MRLPLLLLLGCWISGASTGAIGVGPEVAGPEGQRAFDDLATLYVDGKPVAGLDQALKDLAGNAQGRREVAGRYLLALLKQSLADESNGRAKWKSLPFWGGGAESASREFRKQLADKIANGIFDARVEDCKRFHPLFAAGDRYMQFVADVHAMVKTQRLRAIEGSRSRQDIAQYRGNQRADPHRRRDRIRRRDGAFFARQHQRIGVAGHVGKKIQILDRTGPFNAGAGSDFQFSPGRVSDRGWLLHCRPLSRRNGSTRHLVAASSICAHRRAPHQRL